ACLAADGESLLISNLDTGTDLYSIPRLLPIRSFNQNMKLLIPFQVAVAAPESLVVCGSDRGNVMLFDFHDGSLVQTLSHSSGISQVHSEFQRSIIVSGASGEGPMSIKVWSRAKVGVFST
ncbi:hypothetical protein JAAARDRAFT_143598, partial [Jaapia argillacea MUCL 33604]